MSNADKIADYFNRQYGTEEGSVEDNIASLFTEDLTYHLGDGTVSREALAETAHKMRSSPKESRRVEASAFNEEGNDVTFHLSINVPGVGEDGSDMVMESDFKWRFNDEGKVHEAWALESDQVSDAFKSAGIDLD